MKQRLIIFCLLTTIIFVEAKSQKILSVGNISTIDYISALKDTLSKLSGNSENEFFKMHCNSMISVIESKNSYISADSMFLEQTYNAYNNQADTSNAKELSTYLKRQRPFILSWISPTDGAVSFSWLNPPKNWDSTKEYPVYVQLHGLWDVASNSIEYMTYPFIGGASSDSSFDNGYLLSPWGRGNIWYQGISETDIWECLAKLENIVNIDPSRKYLSGHSMGGYGAWSIASKSPDTWAALGIHAGALWYNNSSLVSADVANVLKDLPTYFVCGNLDGLLSINQTAYNLLDDAGNPDIEFITFTGGHEYVEENVQNMYEWMREFVNEDWNTNNIETPEVTKNESVVRCFPNPVITTTNIVYSVVEKSLVNISIYDIYGRFVNELVNEERTPGEYSTAFDSLGLSTGIYMVRLRSVNVIAESKMIVVK